MIAHERTVAEVAAEVEADSLAYLSLDGVYEAVGSGRETHCDACFTGDYPLEGRARRERQARSRRAPAHQGIADRFPIAVLVSGAGTNLQAILDDVHGRDGIEVDVVVSNKTGAQGARAGAGGRRGDGCVRGLRVRRPRRA